MDLIDHNSQDRHDWRPGVSTRMAACLALFVSYVRTLGAAASAPPDFRGPFAKQQRMFSVAALAVLLAVTPVS